MIHELKRVNIDSTFGGPNFANKKMGDFLKRVISSLRVYSTSTSKQQIPITRKNYNVYG